MNFPKPITDVAEHSTAPHSRGGNAPNAAPFQSAPLANNNRRAVPAGVSAPLSGASAALIMSDGFPYDPKRHGTNPPCLKCRRGFYGCICGSPEPEQESFRPALNRDPDLHVQAMQSREAY